MQRLRATLLSRHAYWASRSIIVLALCLPLIIPPFGCQCANGQIKLGVIPGHCGVAKPLSLCSTQPGKLCCCYAAANLTASQSGKGDFVVCPRNCCQLWVNSIPALISANFDLNFGTDQDLGLFIELMAGGNLAIAPSHLDNHLYPCFCSLPPIDRVVTFLHLTI